MCARGRFWWASGEHLLDRRMAKWKAASTVNSTHTNVEGLTSTVSTHTNVEGLTSTVMCTHMTMVGLTKGSPHFSLLPASHAMARMPLCSFQGLLYNMANHIRTHSTNAEANTQCCSCGKFKSEKGFLICPSCNAVQPLNPAITHFQIFDQDEKFELDLKDLEAKYKSLMKKLHPDLSHGKSTEEKKNYAQLAARVTTAYNELLKPVSRGTYMLKVRGIHVEEEGTVTDSELIMEVMEIRETLQSSPDRYTLEQLHKRVIMMTFKCIIHVIGLEPGLRISIFEAMSRMDEWSTAFKSALKQGNDANAVGALQRMSYFGRVCEDINRELL